MMLRLLQAWISGVVAGEAVVLLAGLRAGVDFGGPAWGAPVVIGLSLACSAVCAVMAARK